ncbi:MAG: N-acetyltransferase [Conexibacter sp.]|nr:N-acetyltransferase [Conexibacter sp.]
MAARAKTSLPAGPRRRRPDRDRPRVTSRSAFTACTRPRLRRLPPSAVVTIRPANPGDAERIAAIYNEGIAERAATFETRPRSKAEVAGWTVASLPVLVAEVDGRIAGFAKVGPYSERSVYAGIGEHAVYVSGDARRLGVGHALLEALAVASEGAGLYKLTSRIFSTNMASIALHEATGFTIVGVQRRHGRLDGEWRDCVLVERLLGDAAG